jgi:hypothetical protein
LCEVLGPVVNAGDTFTARLVDICQRVYNARDMASEVRLHLIRTDYMETFPRGGVLHLEVNTISVAFLAALVEQLSVLHDQVGSPARSVALLLLSATAFAEAIAKAHRAFPQGPAPAKVLVVAEDCDKNEPDQRQLDALLLSRHGVPTVRGSSMPWPPSPVLLRLMPRAP